MQILQNMDPDKMVIVLPTALLAMYFIVSLQKSLCEKQNPLIGLILPVICFVAATILAFRPLLVANAGQYEGLGIFCLRMWLTFNIATLVFLFPYYRQRRMMRAAAEAARAEAKDPIKDAASSAQNVILIPGADSCGIPDLRDLPCPVMGIGN